MWNLFRAVNLEPTIPSKGCDIKPASHPEESEDDAAYMQELNTSRSRTLVARQQISLIHEELALQALDHMRSGKKP
jgi:hypothetical protein